MVLNDTQQKAIDVCNTIKDAFGNRIGTPKVFDVVDDKDHRQFKIGFVAYNFFSVVFQCESDIIGCYIESGRQDTISIVSGRHCLSDTDLNSFFADVMQQLELRIPDKFLKANGWIV